MCCSWIQLFWERLSEKVHAMIPKGMVDGFEFTVLQRNLKERHERPWMYVCEWPCALIPLVLSFYKMFVCLSFLSWPTYIAPVVQKEDTVVVHVHVCATLYPTECFQLKRIAIFNSVRAQMYIPVHLITNPTKAPYMLILANFFGVKCMRFSFLKMSQWLPKIYDDFPKTSKHCWKCPKMFWWPWSILEAI